MKADNMSLANFAETAEQKIFNEFYTLHYMMKTSYYYKA